MAQTFKDKLDTYFLSGLLLVSLIMVIYIIQPYFVTILMSIVLVILMRPMFLWIHGKVGKKDMLASLLTTLAIVLIIIIPVVAFVWLAAHELNAYLSSSGILAFQNIQLPQFVQELNLDFKSYGQNIADKAVQDIGGIFSNLISAFVILGLTIFSLVYLFKDGLRIKQALYKAIPLTEEQKDQLTSDLVNGIRAIIGGYFLISILHGILAGIGLAIFQVPSPALFGFIAAIFALMPIVGTPLVYFPAIIYLFMNNRPGLGIGLLIWFLLTQVIDNYIGPKFVSGRVKIHVLLLILSTVGGLKIYGALGFMIGPLIMIFFWSVLNLFQDKEEELVKIETEEESLVK